MRVPPRITATWIDSLTDDNLLLAELRLKTAFAKEERAEKKRTGRAYDLMRGPAELMLAWDRWSRVNAAARGRKLNPTRAVVTHSRCRAIHSALHKQRSRGSKGEGYGVTDAAHREAPRHCHPERSEGSHPPARPQGRVGG